MNITVLFTLIFTVFIFAGCGGGGKSSAGTDINISQSGLPDAGFGGEVTNHKPVAESVTVTTDEDRAKRITLFASDQDNDTLKYIILTRPLHGVLSEEAPNLLYTPDKDFYGEDSFRFKVNDTKDDSQPAEVKIIVNPVNDAPFAWLKIKKSVIDIRDIAGFDLLNAQRSYDPDGTILTYKFYDNDKLMTESSSPIPCLNAPGCYQLDVGKHYISLIVVDNEGIESVRKSQAVITVIKNDPPVADAGGDITAVLKRPVKIAGKATDKDGVIVSYKWSENNKTIGSSPTLVYTPESVGEHLLTLSVTDNYWANASDDIVVTVVEKGPENTPPFVDAGADLSVKVGESVLLEANATDGDGSVDSYRWEENGRFLSSSKSFKYTPSEGTHIITVTVIDNDSAAASDKIVVTAIKPGEFECTSTVDTEKAFVDTFVNDAHEDVKFFASKDTAFDVEYIARFFDYGRKQDATVSKPLKMPDQQKWDSFSNSRKALFLINSERCARGLRPFEGVSPTIEKVSEKYAGFIATHDKEFNSAPHEADGRTPTQRLEQDGGVIVDQNADFFRYSENIAFFRAESSGSGYPVISNPVVKAVYAWIYEDKESDYGHRNFILATDLDDNSGQKGIEGLIATGVSTKQYTTVDNNVTNYKSEVFVVLNAFDPNENWDMSEVVKTDISE